MKSFKVVVLMFSLLAFASWALAQSSTSGGQTTQTSAGTNEQPSITPQKGQTAEEQKKDLSECYEMAKAKTGIDPSALKGSSKKADAPGAEASSSANEGGTAGSEAAGAAESAGNQAASATGHVATGATKDAKLSKFELANQACLQARGYLVKGAAPAAQPATEQPKP